LHNLPYGKSVLPAPPTNRLSPKNQVTLPRDAAALVGDPAHLRALPHWMPGQADHTQRSPVVLLMSESDLRKRERRIIDEPSLSAEHKLMLVQKLNAGAAVMGIDDQRRVVVPQQFVDYLKLERDVLFVATGDLIYLWNPDEFQRWSGAAAPAGAPDLTQFILV
jgi:DNA-binding transcriptional regulator/RsmH inhibitor MraZ